MTKRVIRDEPLIEPVTLDEAREHLRLDTFGSPASHPDDALIQVYISAARQYCEDYLGHSIASRTGRASFDSVPGSGGYIEILDWPINQIDSITYLNSSGVSQAFDASEYVLDSESAPARVYAINSWPGVSTSLPNVLTINYSTGYTDSESPNLYPLPKSIKSAILLMLGHLYENRQQVGQKMDSVPYGVDYLLNLHRTNLGL